MIPLSALAGALGLAVQLADLATTLIGEHRGLVEIDGTSIWTLVAIKSALLLAVWAVTRKRTMAAWIGFGTLSAIMLPIVVHNFRLISQR